MIATTDGTEAPWRGQLRRLLARLLAERNGASGSAGASEWGAEKTLLRGLGVDLRETMMFVMAHQPTLDVLERWIDDRREGALASEVRRAAGSLLVIFPLWPYSRLNNYFRGP